MNKEFGELKSAYTETKEQNADCNEILEKMRDNLKGRNENKDSISDEVTHRFYTISQVENVEDLYAIDGILNRKSSAEKLERIGIDKRRKYGITNK